MGRLASQVREGRLPRAAFLPFSLHPHHLASRQNTPKGSAWGTIQSQLGALLSSLLRGMAWMPCHGFCTTRTPGLLWAAPPCLGFSSPSSTSFTTPFLLGFGLSCS